MIFCKRIFLFLFGITLSNLAYADSSSPKLAGYYDTFMAICDGNAYGWRGYNSPVMLMDNVQKVAVGKDNSYTLTYDGQLFIVNEIKTPSIMIMNNVASFYAGRSGLLIVRQDNTLWHLPTENFLSFGEKLSTSAVEKIAHDVLTAAVGDSANYYANLSGELFVKGKAHRGQYGDGQLTETDDFIKTATDVIQIVAHTGHALILKNDGSVWGTGGNINGPISKHGLGDKAVGWSMIMGDAIAIATGSSHSLAITTDHSLWIWGRNETIDPKILISKVDAVAAGNDTNIALKDGYLWQWDTGSTPNKLFECLNE